MSSPRRRAADRPRLVLLLRRQGDRRGAGGGEALAFVSRARHPSRRRRGWSRSIPDGRAFAWHQSMTMPRSSAAPRPKAARPTGLDPMPDLLIELFSEEIPARMQAQAAADLKRLVTDGLVEAGLTYASAGAFATPRRLALSVEGLTAAKPGADRRAQGPAHRRARGGAGGVPALDRADPRAAGGPRHRQGRGLVRRDRHARPPRGRDRRRGAGDGDPQLPLAEVDALGRRAACAGCGPLHSILCLLTDEAGAEVVPLDARRPRRRRHHARPPLHGAERRFR